MYTRREEGDDEARLEEKSAHETVDENANPTHEISESADASGLDYASLPRVALKGDAVHVRGRKVREFRSAESELRDFERV